MTVTEAINKRRTIRKFSDKPVSQQLLLELCDCARLAAFGGNLQPLKFCIINTSELCSKIYPYIKWAAYFDNYTIEEAERPKAYIAVIGDRSIKKGGSFDIDCGAAVTNILLAAQEQGACGCWLGAIDREAIADTLSLGEGLELCYLVALGYPAQSSKTVSFEGSVKYYFDENKTLCVPKRSLDEVIIKL